MNQVVEGEVPVLTVFDGKLLVSIWVSISSPVEEPYIVTAVTQDSYKRRSVKKTAKKAMNELRDSRTWVEEILRSKKSLSSSCVFEKRKTLGVKEKSVKVSQVRSLFFTNENDSFSFPWLKSLVFVSLSLINRKDITFNHTPWSIFREIRTSVTQWQT